MDFVYLLENTNESNTVYKIGFTKKTIRSRIRPLQTGNAYEITELYKFPTKYNRRLETSLHRHYKIDRMNGEWFKLSETDVENFLAICERLEKGFDALKDNPFFKY
jgi:hypothetical protein